MCDGGRWQAPHAHTHTRTQARTHALTHSHMQERKKTRKEASSSMQDIRGTRLTMQTESRIKTALIPPPYLHVPEAIYGSVSVSKALHAKNK